MSARPVPSVPAKPLKSLGWLLVASAAGCVIAAHAGMSRAAPLAGILATLALTIALVVSARGRFRAVRVALTLLAGTALAVALARGHLQSLPQLLPPVLIPMLLAWTFGRTLRRGHTPLIERVARAVHDVPELEPAMRRYTRGVTASWTTLFIAFALVNAFLLCNAMPGGLLDLAGAAPPWPVPLATCTLIGGPIMGLVLVALFGIEYFVRLARFPDYRFRNPVGFVRNVRRRWPEIAASLRDE